MPEIEDILRKISKPSRYIDHEYNAIHKNPHEVQVRVALAFPDLYEIGMPNLGLQILYEILNQREDTLAERVYAPDLDMEEQLRLNNIPLFSLESQLPLGNFDIVGFTLSYEMTYTNILNMLDLAHIPLLAEKRTLRHPLIIAGGPGAYNPEPLAPYFDLLVIGDGEEVVTDLINRYKEQRLKAKTRQELIAGFIEIPGVYIPNFYQVNYDDKGKILKINAFDEKAALPVTKRIVEDLDCVAIPLKSPVPFLNVVHDRASIEIMRGCTRGCRFCQAGIVYRPVRERSEGLLKSSILQLLKSSGYEEVSLASLSSADYSAVSSLLNGFSSWQEHYKVAVSLPSLRIDTFSVELASKIQKVKKTGLTFAPEAGSQRLRNVINKCVDEEDMLRTACCAFEAGWRRLKLYFMIGLPTETQDDLESIVEMVRKVVDLGKRIIPRNEQHRLHITVSVASFVPKPHTPFQWVGQGSLEDLVWKQNFLKKNLRGRHLSLKWHDAEMSVVEAVIARGDRRLAKALYQAWKLGCRFDGWSDHFQFEKWQQAMEQAGLEIEFYAKRERELDEILPWEHISSGVSKEFLVKEYEQARKGILTPDCRWDKCVDCGICTRFQVRNIIGSSNV